MTWAGNARSKPLHRDTVLFRRDKGTMTKDERKALARRYAEGDFTMHDLRREGHSSMIELLSDIDELGLRLPMAANIGPNVELRTAGLARLAQLLRR